MKPHKSTAETRFGMIKSRHTESFQHALNIGRMDTPIISLCEYISKTNNYYTTSSCSGRIILLDMQGNEKDKRESLFHFKKHEFVQFEEIWKSLNEKTQGTVWFKMDSFILHLGTDSLENAEKIIQSMKKAGIKRGGIMVAKEGKFLTEFQGTQTISLPVKEKNTILIEQKYLKHVVEIANQKLEKNLRQLERLEKEIKKTLK
ncbi:MAG: hypothetical protein Q7S92_01660 [Candidatus Diapherotrites archaeon]|nr:hypothetical protein [Candidatus Diapherotrites archaeon]